MDPCEAVEKEVDKVIKSFTEVKSDTVDIINEIISVFTVLLNSLGKENWTLEMFFVESWSEQKPLKIYQHLDFAMRIRHLIEFAWSINEREFFVILGSMESDSAMTQEQTIELRNVVNRCKTKLQTIGTDHRNLHSTVSKVGKAIDRHFTTDTHEIAPVDLYSSTRLLEVLNQVIAEHFNRQGMTDVAESLVAESQLPSEVDIHLELYADLYQMWEGITQRNLGPAIEWVTQYSQELDLRNSSLEFKLHRLAYVQILSKGVTMQGEAIAYARSHFKKFTNKFEKEIQMLMGCLIYLPMGYENTPYISLFDSSMWVDAADSFLRETCDIVGVSKDSALEIIINSGCHALPLLMNLKQIMMRNNVGGVWSERNELPIEINLGSEMRFHSMFTCPILKHPTNEQNPPMKLKCNHVISKDAMAKLVRGTNNLLKCPYCPKESTTIEAKKIYFWFKIHVIRKL